MRKHFGPVLATVIVSAHVLVAPGASADVITFSDTEFVDANWSAFELTDTSPSNSFVFTGAQLLAGGNPGAFRHVTQAIDEVPPPNGPSPVNIQSAHVFLPGSFDPGEDGTFVSLDWSFDGISTDSTAGAIFYGLLAFQDGKVFLSANASGNVLNGESWQEVAASDLGALDFTPFDGVSVLDLSDVGGPVTFGFLASNGTFGLSFNDGGVDNFLVRITTFRDRVPGVPEPGALALVLAGFLGLIVTARRHGLRHPRPAA